MIELTKNWKTRTIIISAIFIITCLIVYLLDGSDWANSLRENGFGRPEGTEGRPERPRGEAPNGVLRFLGSFLKEFVLIGVPMAITLAIGALIKFSIRKVKKAK